MLALISRSLLLPDASHNALPLYYLDPHIQSFLVSVDVDVDLIGRRPRSLSSLLPSFPPSLLPSFPPSLPLSCVFIVGELQT